MIKVLLFLAGIGMTVPTLAACDYETADSLIQKELIVLAKRYQSKKVGLGVSINNGPSITTSIAIFQGKGGDDGVKVDRIGTITVDLNKCAIHNTLVGIFDVIDLE